MTFDIVNFTLAADLANAGTVTVGYPSGMTKGDYNLWSTGKHVMQVGQNIYNAPKSFTLAFNANASNITLTNASGGTFKAGTSCSLQLERRGKSIFDLNKVVNPNQVKTVNSNIFLLDLGSPNALNTSGMCASQSVSAAAAFLLNGTGTDVTANSDGSVTLNTPRNITAAWTTTSVLTIKGKDQFGNAMTENSASGTSHTGKKAFKTVTSITSSASITSATVGYGDVLGLSAAIHAGSQVLTEISGGSRIGGQSGKQRVYWSLNQVDLLAGSGNSAQIVCPCTGIVTKVGSVVRKAITTGGTLTFQDAATAFAGATITIANSAAQGAAQNVTPTAGDASLVVTKNDILQVVPASFATAGEVDGYIEINPTGDGLISGALVVADGTAATAITGDVCGTYKPELATDGTTNLALIVMLTNPEDIGVTQF